MSCFTWDVPLIPLLFIRGAVTQHNPEQPDVHRKAAPQPPCQDAETPTRARLARVHMTWDRPDKVDSLSAGSGGTVHREMQGWRSKWGRIEE